jgi:polyferredoxin/type III secretory pathway lipoprotein EscJ
MSLAGFGSLIYWNSKPEYQILFSNLSQEDAGEMVNKLKEKKIPFQLSANGGSILVARDQVYDTRLSLAAEGLPKGGGVGFEVFDRTNLGATDFVQKLNYQRALQGELSRTIRQIKEIEQARVHIVTPKESLFIEEQKKPSASVLLKTRSGMKLEPSQVEGIVHLVASAVEGLDSGNITVVDTSGKILFKRNDSTLIGQMTTNQLEYQRNIEEGLKKKVQGMLEEVLGLNKAIALAASNVSFPLAAPFILAAGLVFLTTVLVFQDWLAKRPRLLVYVRDGFMLFTIFFIGWYSLAQLSVVNVLTFVHSIMRDFQWESFLIDPMMFILWAFVAVTLLLWGRSVYCGWLCPYGALQELTQQLARRLGARQFEFSEMVHERLWAVKYIILLGLFGVSLQSLAQAERLAEIEPFKTAITLRFQREWGYVFFAGGLILVSAVNRKFFCKYMCPLGAALTIPGKFRIFDWLRRHRECGHPCQVCAVECEVQAIRKNGEINANECHYCLDCQVTYWNDRKCPPMVERRKRRKRAPRALELVHGMETHLGSSGIDDIGTSCEGCAHRPGL